MLLESDPQTLAGEDPNRGVGRFRWPDEFPYAAAIVFSLCAGGLLLLLLPAALTYDATSWLVWGRQLDHLALSTRGAGASFKPLTVAITALLTPSGHAAAQLMWLAVVRGSAVFSMLLAFHLGRRFQGPLAGLIAAFGIFSAHQLLSYLVMEGASEPLLVACCLAAVDSGLRGRTRATQAWLAAASLLQIDLAGMFLLYGIVFQVWPATNRWRASTALLAGLIAMGLAWTLPDLISTGNALRSESQAQIPVGGGPLLTSFPAWAVIKEMRSVLLAPLVLGWGFELALDAWYLLRQRLVRPLLPAATAALVFLLEQAVATQLRETTGTPRFLLAGAGVVAVVGACFWVGALRVAAAVAVEPFGAWRRSRGIPRPAGAQFAARRLLTPPVALVIAALVIRYGVDNVRVQVQRLRTASQASQVLATEQGLVGQAVAAVGGRRAMLACGPVFTGPGWEPSVAWTVGLPFSEVSRSTVAAYGTIIYSTTGQSEATNITSMPRLIGTPQAGLIVVSHCLPTPAA